MGKFGEKFQALPIITLSVIWGESSLLLAGFRKEVRISCQESKTENDPAFP